MKEFLVAFAGVVSLLTALFFAMSFLSVSKSLIFGGKGKASAPLWTILPIGFFGTLGYWLLF